MDQQDERLPRYSGNAVVANCPDCAAPTTFEARSVGGGSGGMFTIREVGHSFQGMRYRRILYHLFRCAVCGRGGLAVIHDNGHPDGAVLECFLPSTPSVANMPVGTPEKIRLEFEEAQTCFAAGAYRAASAMYRSALEKTLQTNGYTSGTLRDKIDLAAKDGVITEGRKRRAHDEVMVLGNDILHDEWRLVEPEEVQDAQHYTQRFIEDLYDERASVLQLLIEAGRLKEEVDASNTD